MASMHAGSYHHGAAVVNGSHYLDVLSRLHTILHPRMYLEIGTSTGASLALARCAPIASDPVFVIDSNVMAGKPVCMLFQMTSDALFLESFAQKSCSVLPSSLRFWTACICLNFCCAISRTPNNTAGPIPSLRFTVERFYRELAIESTEAYTEFQDIASRFWLPGDTR